MGSTRVCLWGITLPARRQVEVGPILYRPIDPGDATTLAATMGLPVDAVKARQTWSRCHGGLVGDEIATFGWVSHSETPIGEIAASIRPAGGEAYIWDCRTRPAFRGRGFYRNLLAHMLADLSRDGLHRIWIATLEGSGAGTRGVQRAGFHPVLRIRFLQLGPVRWWRVRPDPDAEQEETQAARRALRLGQPPEAATPTRPNAAPPAAVRNR